MDHAIEADDGLDTASNADSGYDETLCSTDSLRSSVFAYEQENGRTYHAYHAGKYHVPNDEGEQERMDIHYHALRLSIEDRIFHAPLKDPMGILDVGAGTGIWAMDAADSYPGAQVIGFDLSPIQPTVVPPNLTFEVQDADESWDYGADRFDLVHSRFMNGFSIKSWDHFYQEAYAALKPGGWVENQEFDCVVVSDDGSIPPKSKVQEWVTLWNQGMTMVGMTGRCNPDILAGKMRDAGFINVEVKYYKMPIGPWPKDPMLKEAGIYGLVAIVDGMQGLSMKIFTRVLGWSVEALEVFLASVRKEFKNRSVHSYWPCFVIMGQKPSEREPMPTTSSEAVEVNEVLEARTEPQGDSTMTDRLPETILEQPTIHQEVHDTSMQQQPAVEETTAQPVEHQQAAIEETTIQAVQHQQSVVEQTTVQPAEPPSSRTAAPAPASTTATSSKESEYPTNSTHASKSDHVG